MKTKGITYARAKNCIALSILALISAFPALAQVNFASLKGTSFATPDKKSATGIIDYYAVSGTVTRQPNIISVDLFTSSSSPEKNYKAEEKDIYADAGDAKKNAGRIGKNKEADAENVKISFKQTSFSYPENSRTDIGITQYSANQLILYAKVLKQYAKKNGFDTNYAFFSNMGMRSNKKRFFVINLATMQIEQSGLVAHGRGQGPSIFDKQYSNQTGSKCTSLGRYKISGKYNGGYGEAYKMVGLDSSNKNAYNRNIVLHSMTCIPDVDGIMPACVSEGCPAVSSKFLTSLRKIIDTRKKPVLLWIFDSNLEEAVVEDRSTKSKPGSENNILIKHHTCAIHLSSHDDQDIQ
ncbi:MAG: murein L,D-transpeptidase catalytic domain-containing protein [Chitinophagaceae bacterium]